VENRKFMSSFLVYNLYEKGFQKIHISLNKL